MNKLSQRCSTLLNILVYLTEVAVYGIKDEPEAAVFMTGCVVDGVIGGADKGAALL